jgi:hypothetical protein
MAVNLVNAEVQVRLNITDLELSSQISFIWAQWKGTDESSRERNNILFGKNGDFWLLPQIFKQC